MACQLAEFGAAMVAERHRREHPGAADDDSAERVIRDLGAKLLACDDRHRPADADDLRALAEVADDSDWKDAEEAVSLIGDRGYSRGRDLVAALRELRTAGAY